MKFTLSATGRLWRTLSQCFTESLLHLWDTWDNRGTRFPSRMDTSVVQDKCDFLKKIGCHRGEGKKKCVKSETLELLS